MQLLGSNSPRKTTIQDYKTLAFACQRAGKLRQEGHAYYNMGVLYDNEGKHKQAIAAYKKFLNISRRMGDTKGEALALNCLGVCSSRLGSEEGLREAIEYHLEHGFVCACVSGLCWSRLLTAAYAVQ